MSPMLAVVDGSGIPSDESSLHDLGKAILDAWQEALVVYVANLAPAEEPLAYYDRLVEIIGTPHDLAEDATVGDRDQQRVGKRWMEVRYDPSVPNAFRHSDSAQPLHTDGSYIPSFPAATLMFCLSAASEGGATIFLDRADLLAMLEQRDPALLRRLRETPIRHRRSGDQREVPAIRDSDKETLLNWNFFCVDNDASPEARELADDFFRFLQDERVDEACIPVELRPGEAVVWKDDRVLHGRRPFTAQRVSERFIWKCAVDVGVW